MALRPTPLVLFLTFLLRAQQQPNPAAAVPSAPPFVMCPAGSPLGALELQVEAGGQRLPFRTISRLSEGDTLLYAPVLRGKEKRRGEVALVLVPLKREPGQPDIVVTEPVDADKPNRWKMKQTIALTAVVYGPAGLNRKNVAKFLSRDEVLVAQLADYADKTAEAQQLVATLSNRESSMASVNAALNGFASQYGFAIQIDRNAPAAAQAQTVFASMNPQLAGYNPLATSPAQGVGQTASLATMAAALFFGSPVGLAAGGTAMLLDLRAIAFPDTQFRASFAQPLPGSTAGFNLCGQQGPVPPHTRVAYIWASRVPNIPPPAVRISEPGFVPSGLKTAIAVEASDAEWKYLDRARDWSLIDGQGKATPIPVVKLGSPKMLELDLTKAALPAGDYTLGGKWDWTAMQATGVIHVRPVSDLTQAHIDPASQDRLLAASGNVTARVTGSDFEFATKVEVRKLNDEFATAEPARFLLPKGLRQGPQDHLDVQIATQSLAPGGYELLITQVDGKSRPVPFKILANPPRIDNLPILLNQGGGTQHFVLKGERLGQINRLEAAGVVLNLSPAAASHAERSLTAELQSAPAPGTKIPVRAYFQDRSEPVTLPDAVEITGPLPVIASAKLSPPAGLPIAIRSGEFPAGYTLNALLDVKNIERTSVLRLRCAEGVGEPVALHIGEQTGRQSLQQLSPDQLFLAFDSASLPAGCALEAVIDNPRQGASKSFPLAQIVRLPKLETLTVSADPPQEGTRQYRVTGENLEMIQRLGWTEVEPVDVAGLPQPQPGPGLKQSIDVRLADPPKPEATLWVWLRGDREGRATTTKAPALPVDVPAAPPVPSPNDPAAAPPDPKKK